jgi:hypothetical protein
VIPIRFRSCNRAETFVVASESVREFAHLRDPAGDANSSAALRRRCDLLAKLLLDESTAEVIEGFLPRCQWHTCAAHGTTLGLKEERHEPGSCSAESSNEVPPSPLPPESGTAYRTDSKHAVSAAGRRKSHGPPLARRLAQYRPASGDGSRGFACAGWA